MIIASMISAFTTGAVYGEEVDKSAESMETITVVGEKIERSLKDTSSSVSVITEKLLKSMQHLPISVAGSDMAML